MRANFISYLIFVLLCGRPLAASEKIKTADDLLNNSEQQNVQNDMYELNIGALAGSYVYNEPGVVSHSGFMLGAWGRWTYENFLYEGLVSGQIATGRLNYDGSLCSISTGNCTAYQAKTNQTVAKVAHYFRKEIAETPFHIFAGIGYRYLFDRGETSAFYRRTGNYVYAPVGFTFERQVPDWNGWLQLQVEYGVLLSGQMQSQLSDVNSTWSDMKHIQNRGYQYQILVSLWTRSKPYQWFPDMYVIGFERWSLEASDLQPLVVSGSPTTDLYLEPKNYSEFMSLAIGWSPF